VYGVENGVGSFCQTAGIVGIIVPSLPFLAFVVHPCILALRIEVD